MSVRVEEKKQLCAVTDPVLARCMMLPADLRRVVYETGPWWHEDWKRNIRTVHNELHGLIETVVMWESHPRLLHADNISLYYRLFNRFFSYALMWARGLDLGPLLDT